MGSSDGQSDEKPVHQVTLQGFSMDVTEVTVAQYQECVSDGGCSPRSDDRAECSPPSSSGDEHPASCVDWSQATSFCSWAGKRLPTEEEWEYAAKGTDGRKFPWGNQAPSAQLLNALGSTEGAWKERAEWAAMFSGSDGYEATAPVESFPAGVSPFGLHDMAGNVREWTSSRYCNYLEACGAEARAIRGGSWKSELVSSARSAFREWGKPSNRYDDVGFRCAR